MKTIKELEADIKKCEIWCKRMGIMEKEATELIELRKELKQKING